MNKSRIALSLALALGTSVASAVTATMTSGTFDMYTGTGNLMNSDAAITGSIGDGTWSVASTNVFFGGLWTAHSGTTFGPGTYSFDTVQAGSYTNVIVGAGQVGGHILFNWGANADIDVVNVWDVVGSSYTSTDVLEGAGGDGILGLGMIDGAFVGSSANFDFVAPVPVPAAVWLFGSGLLGLVGVARRKKSA